VAIPGSSGVFWIERFSMVLLSGAAPREPLT
jgi:hypothetical protein